MCFIPNQSCHETHQPRHTADTGEGFCHDELLALWTLRPAWMWWKVFHIQNHFWGCDEKKKPFDSILI